MSIPLVPVNEVDTAPSAKRAKVEHANDRFRADLISMESRVDRHINNVHAAATNISNKTAEILKHANDVTESTLASTEIVNALNAMQDIIFDIGKSIGCLDAQHAKLHEIVDEIKQDATSLIGR